MALPAACSGPRSSFRTQHDEHVPDYTPRALLLEFSPSPPSAAAPGWIAFAREITSEAEEPMGTGGMEGLMTEDSSGLFCGRRIPRSNELAPVGFVLDSSGRPVLVC